MKGDKVMIKNCQMIQKAARKERKKIFECRIIKWSIIRCLKVHLSILLATININKLRVPVLKKDC